NNIKMFNFNLIKLSLLAAFLWLNNSSWLQAQSASPSLTSHWDRDFSRLDASDTRLITLPDGGYLYFGYPDSEASGFKSENSRGGSDYWVLKLDANWKKVWDNSLGGSENEVLKDVIALEDGGLILGGYSSSGASADKSEGSRGGRDFWLVKLDKNGQKIWDKTYGGDQDETFSKIQLLADGSMILGGSSQSGISGEKSQARQGESDYWIIHVDAEGNILWDKTFGGNQADELVDITLLKDGSLLLGGNSTSGVSGDKTEANGETWIIRTDDQGNKVWDKTYVNVLADMLLLPDGAIALGGNEVFDPIFQVFSLIKINEQGEQFWARTYIPKNDDTQAETLVRIISKPGVGILCLGHSNLIPRGFNEIILNIDPSSGDKIWDEVKSFRIEIDAKYVDPFFVFAEVTDANSFKPRGGSAVRVITTCGSIS
ncbi:MAG: hypothetical protein AAFU64_14070, partial [Bacteroidota bacterium]